MSSCTINAYVKRPDGSVVESKFWKDLMKYTSNREEAKEHYAVGTNQKFLDLAGDRVIYDENGEITLESYNKIVSIDKGNLSEILNKEIKSGVYPYMEAVRRLQEFNRTSPFKNKYIATITPSGNSYKLEVVKRTTAVERSLDSMIANQTLQNRLIYYLNRLGVAVDFLENGNQEKGRYSTVNAEKSADGLYHLIKIANGDSVTETMAEEAGHFAVASLQNTPLVQRLFSILTDDVIQEVLGNDYKDKILSGNPVKEAAGVLVGRAFMSGYDNKTPWQKLAGRIATYAKTVFAKLKGNDVKLAAINAQKMANKIAEGFASPEFEGTVETALSTPETLYSAKASTNIQTYRQVLQRLIIFNKQLKNITEDSLSQEAELLVARVESTNGILMDDASYIGDILALQGITEALDSILDMIGEGKEVSRLLSSINFDSIADFTNSLAENGKKLRQVQTFLTNSLALEEIVSNVYASLKFYGESVDLNDKGVTRKINFQELLNNLRTANADLRNDLRTKQLQYFGRFLQDSYGEKYMAASTRVLWRKEGGKMIFKPVEEAAKNEEAISQWIEDNLRHLEKDATLIGSFLSSMGNSPDIISQIIDKVVKQTHMVAQDMTMNTLDELRKLRIRLNDLGYKDTTFLFEIGRDGKLTGNIISEHNWGDWEADRKEFMGHAKTLKDGSIEYTGLMKEFMDKEGKFLQGKSEMYKAHRWSLFKGKKLKKWNEEHSSFQVTDIITGEGRWVPNSTYNNPNFKKLVPENSELRKWYDDYRTLKENLDRLLPEGSTLDVRMPQFKAIFANKISNRKMFEKPLQAIKHSIGSEIRETFCEDVTDTMFGSNQTFNSEEEEIFKNSLDSESEKIHRLPIYGINKLPNMSDLSTDLFHTTLAYADMVHTYSGVSNIVDAIEVGSSVLENRSVGRLLSEKEVKGDKSNTYRRYLKYVEKQVYGIGMKRHKFTSANIVLEKVTAAATKCAAFEFLGGNIPGGLVNVGTGFIEIFKEAVVGDYINLKEWKDANAWYWKNLIGQIGQNTADLGRQMPESDMALLLRYFGIRDTNRELYKTWNTRHSWFFNFINDSIWFPYKAGDHYMQSIPYIALALRTKVYNASGDEINLIDAFKIDEESVEGSKNTIKTIKLKDTFYRSKEDIQTHKVIKSLIDKIQNSNKDTLTKEEQDYLSSHNYDINDFTETLNRLELDLQHITWGDDDKANFMNKAREICIRLHGIYNNYDKVMLNQNWFGNAFLALKSWALGMGERRFGRNHYNISLGKYVEGSLVTLVKASRSLFTDKNNMLKTLRCILLPVFLTNKGKNNMMQALQQVGFDEEQFKNLQRNCWDAMFILSLLLIRSLTGATPPEDDEWKKKYGKNWRKYKDMYNDNNNTTLGIINYFANRLYREQSALTTPMGWYYEASSLLNPIPAGLSSLTDFYELTEEFIGAQIINDKEDSRFYYQQNKEGFYEKGDPKWITKGKRFVPYWWKTGKVFNYPYESTKSFEYGRLVKQR